jgi:APA family basic amino acid/polyamine antiporter
MTATVTPTRHITVLYVVMVAVAMVVGAGIFRSPSEIAANADSAFWFFGAWVAGGAICLAGALCYAELATTFPNAGGDYHFLKMAYGRNVAFLFAWARFAVINTGSIALLGFVLGDYANAAYPLGEQGASLYALGAIVALTLFNLKGLYRGIGADYSMTGLEVVGLLIIFAAGVVLASGGVPPLVSDPPAPVGVPPTIGTALLFVLFAFSGWSEVATLSAEIVDARRGMLKALVAAILVITVLYLLANWALWRGLGIEGLAASTTPAADVIGLAFGDAAGLVTAIAISLAVLTSINATIIVGARTTYAAAADWPVLARLGRWDAARGVPVRAILAQSAVAVLLVGLGTWTRNGFATMIDFTSPVFWFFLAASGIAVIVLRRRHARVERPFRVPWYPWLPLLFTAACLFVLWSSVQYVRLGAVAGIGVLLLGGLLIVAMSRGRAVMARRA